MKKEISMICQKCKKGVIKESYDTDYFEDINMECGYCGYTFSIYGSDMDEIYAKSIKKITLILSILFAISSVICYIYDSKMILEAAVLIGLTCLAFMVSFFTKVN